MEPSIASHGKASHFADLTKENKEFKKAKKVIVLPESKRLEEINEVGDPKYCKFHRVLDHPISKCFILKEKITMLVSEGKIIIDMDETLEANHASVAPNQKKCSKSQIMPNTISLQFGSFTPIEVDFPKKTSEGSLEIHDNEADGWTLVTHKKRRHQEVLRIRLPKTRTIRNGKTAYNLFLGRPWVHENGVVPYTLHQCMKYCGRSNIEEPTQLDSIDLVDSKVQWAAIKMSKKRIKEGQPLPKECTQQVHPPRKELCHTTFQDLKEKMIVPVAQVPSIPLDPSKGNTQFGELRDEVIDEKIDGLTKSQMWLRKKGYYVSTPRLGPKDEEESSEQVHGDATTSKTSVFHRLGAKRKSLSGKTLLEHENQDFCDVTNNKEIHSVFLSRMKRKTVLSITTDGSLKVKRTTVVFTNQFHEKTKNDKGEAITDFVENQREDSNLIQSSYHITVEEGPHIDDTNDDVQEAPPQLEDDVQASIDNLKELHLGTHAQPSLVHFLHHKKRGNTSSNWLSIKTFLLGRTEKYQALVPR
ncbi:hypothetical protein KY290_017267 [Solanum tuberosum]|uniref:Ty3-gypsy retrotransposon protein n=1 Tax=Solanum tuberosum TaxID=4113 RepID=A0ABQ7VAT8_SOLTU|nr:hypothetical protein KY284_016291 [Solanum tuberosum]KAH0704323.1 hypothetical protein KY285_018601 [Solanum tuberosum]KAH0761194.1 hypothetical protein KY290_017267 [Solanum tuberosum]